MTDLAPASPSTRSARAERLVQILLPAATLVLFLATLRGYGIFRDELYYLACGERLALGYVDQPPLIAFVAAAVRALLGTSLVALRLLPALAAAATVWLALRIARTLGGGPFAQAAAGLATALAPIYLSLFSILSMNAFDVLFWAALWWLAARLLAGADPRLWLAFGALAGVGLLNKISVLFFGLGLAVGLVAARRWDVVRARWAWLGAGAAALLFLPHLVWQAQNDWPTLEFMRNARVEKIAAFSALDFLRVQTLHAGPVATALALAGLVFLLRAPAARPWRALGWAWIAVLATILATGGKPYYAGASYTLLFAAGGVAVERWLETGTRRRLRPAVLAALLMAGAVVAPLAKPLLPVDAYVAWAARLGIEPGTDERHRLGRLPQFYADMHGWPELVSTVAEVYHALPPAERQRACVFGQNYGEAGAIDLFGPALGLPKAISAHNSYWLWGPRDCSGEVVIVIGDDRETLAGLFRSVERASTFDCADCMPYEDDLPIWIARDLVPPIAELWPRIKRFV